MRAEAYTDDRGLRAYWFRPDEPGESSRAWRWFIILCIFLVGFFCGVAAAQASEPPCVQLHLRPTVMLIRQDIDVQARVCRQDGHRELRIDWTSDVAGAGSSFFQLNGATEPVLHAVWLRDQSPANYEFLATVRDGRGRVVGRDRALIRGPGAPPGLAEVP